MPPTKPDAIPNVGSGLSLVLMVFILVSMAVMQHFDTDEEAARSIL